MPAVYSYASQAFEGCLISVEADMRRALPGIDIVGLPDKAVKESRERVRIAIGKSGFQFPTGRILINLAPADMQKEGASYDLAIALAILRVSGQIPLPGQSPKTNPHASRHAEEESDGLSKSDIMPDAMTESIKDGISDGMTVLGELLLSGAVRPVRGILSAVAGSLEQGIRRFLVPEENYAEASLLLKGRSYSLIPLRHLSELQKAETLTAPKIPLALSSASGSTPQGPAAPAEDFSDLRGQPYLKRALQVGLCGRHHLFLFGPPGCGKTMAARRCIPVLPDLNEQDALELTRIWSLSGRFRGDRPRFITRPTLRAPHHSSSLEGLVGGTGQLIPGEISLAHKGLLLLDEAPEFAASVLQSLREPLETGKIHLSRAGRSGWFPADFQLLLTANPCPCGHLGNPGSSCSCSPREIRGYWKRLGGALLDRIDIRFPVSPLPPEELFSENRAPGMSSADMRKSLRRAFRIQKNRFKKEPAIRRNGDIPGDKLSLYCPLSPEASRSYATGLQKFRLSSRGAAAVLKVARSIADLDGQPQIQNLHILEAFQYRRYGDKDIFWTVL